jgi:hypothetical protein
MSSWTPTASAFPTTRRVCKPGCTDRSGNGVNRDVFLGDIMLRGNAPTKDIDLNALRAEIRGALQNVRLTPGPHWLKIVYSQNDGKPMTVAVTLDNADHPELTNAVKRLPWPRLDGVYIAKQFSVIK